MHSCPKAVPQYFIPGNRDIGNEKFKNEGTVLQKVVSMFNNKNFGDKSEIFIKDLVILSPTMSPTLSPTSFKRLEIFDVHFLNDKQH